MRLLQQTVATARISVMGIWRRKAMSLSTILSVALVVLVLVGFLSMAAGFKRAVAGAGSPMTAIFLAKGSTSELNSSIAPAVVRRIDEAPGILRDGEDPLLSAEIQVIVTAARRDGGEANLALRGIGPRGLAVRPMAQLVEGRMPAPGTSEVVVGRAAAREFEGLALGQSKRLGAADWTVVGLFEANGSVFESEVWADARVISAMFGGGAADYQSIRARLTTPASLAEIEAFVAANPSLNLSVRSEAEFYAEQSRGMGSIIQYLAWPLAVAMAIGALAGALNTMYTSVAVRGVEIATLRTLGFGGLPIFLSTVVEAVMLGLCGAILGLGLCLILLDGLSASTIGGNLSQVLFRLELTPAIAGEAIGLALAIALAGGIFPAWRAVRRPICDGLANG